MGDHLASYNLFVARQHAVHAEFAILFYQFCLYVRLSNAGTVYGRIVTLVGASF